MNAGAPSQDWPGRFRHSLEEWAERQCPDKDAIPRAHFTGSLDDAIAGRVADPSPESALVRIALRALLVQKLDGVYSEIELALGLCESPIERPMMLAVVIVAHELGCSVRFRTSDSLRADTGLAYGAELTLQPQAVLGEYRVDFLLEYTEVVPDFDHPVKTRSGEEIPGAKTIRKTMIIECDGHDFHERTKTQAQQDRKRDRALQSLGHLVFRFTGSELWEDVFSAAHQALRALQKAAADAW